MAADIRTQTTPKVSVIIPAYNHERFVAAAVESVRSQTLADFELIIIDDGSTDRTLQVLEGIADPRIRLLSQENRGAAGTINRGIGLARCPYIAILNSDDVYHPERLARMTQLLDDRPDVMLVSSLVEPIEASGSPVQPTSEHAAWQKWYEDALQQVRDDEPPLQSLLKYNYVVSSSNIVMRRSFFDSHRGFNERLAYCHDYELLLRVSGQYPVEVLRERLVYYRLHEANTINQNAFLKHLEILYCLFTTMDMDDLLAKPSPAERSAGDLYRGLIENPEINPAIRLSEWNAMLETMDRQLRQAHTQLQQADAQLQREDARLQQAYTQLQQADTWLRDVQSQLKAQQDLLEAKDRQLYETGQRLENLSAQLETKERLLQEIYASRGWRWLTRYRKMKAFLGIAPGKKLRMESRDEKPDSGTYHAKIKHPLNEDRPKIIHAIANVWVGGSSRLVVDLIEHLGHKYDQEVVTYGIPDPLAYDGFPCHDFSRLSSPDTLAAFLREKEANILHVHYWGEDNKPWYEHVFGAADLHPCLVIENVNTPVETYFHDKINRYVYVSEFARKLYGPVPDDSRVIYPGSNLDLFRRLDHDVPDDAIGMVYRLERDKLNEESIDVFIDVVKERPSTKAYIIGAGTFFNLYQEKARAAGVLDNFIFTGYVPYESLPDYYRKFSLFVAPVWKESFGQVSTFAMGMGIPVVGYHVGGLPEMLGSEEFLASSRSQLAGLIVDLLNDREKRIEIGMLNRRRARDLFSVEAMIAQYDRLYEGLLAERQ